MDAKTSVGAQRDPSGGSISGSDDPTRTNSGPGSKRMMLGVNAGTLTGRVEDERKQPATGVFVILVPDARTARLFRTDMSRMTSTDADGRFEIKNLPPGDYKAFALDGFEKDSWFDPDFFKPYEERGITVRVEEGKTQTLPAPLAPIRQ